jgi:hypothetical protein
MGDSKYIDFYELLQVHPKAGSEVIKKAYYTLMQQNHPDKGGSEELAKKINEAYNVLTNTDLRKRYDHERNLRLIEKVKANSRAVENVDKKEKKPKPANVISKNCPVLSSYGTLVSDERGNRVLIINSEGEITWEYGKFGTIYSGKLKSPKYAQFIDNQNILITDSGNSRIIEVTAKKDTLWQFGTGEKGYGPQTLDNPSSSVKLPNGNYLICDTGNKRVIEVNKVGEIVWQYGDLKDNKMFGKSIFGSMFNKTSDILFNPVFAQRLENGNTLISDTGNRKLLEVTSDKKVVWQFPPKKDEKKEYFFGANFVQRLPNGNTLFSFDKIYELNPEGEVIWTYGRNVSDLDINWAYKPDHNTLLFSMTRVVRRGVNQEIMMTDLNGKTLWRYYYSQYKHV